MEAPIKTIHGNITGLKPSQIKTLENLYRRKIPPTEALTAELARRLTEASAEVRRQVAAIVDRSGEITHVVVGDEKRVLIPDLSEYRVGQRRLRGLRVIHTHLKGEPLSKEDLTDMALLRLDLMVMIPVTREGLPGKVEIAHISPPDREGHNWTVLPPSFVPQIDIDFQGLMSQVEYELTSAEVTVETPGKEKAILVHVVTDRKKDDAAASLAELKELARTSEVAIVEAIIQRPDRINPKYVLGEGKLKELLILAQQKGAGLIIFDQNLTPAQARAIATATDMRVIDRTQLILDIFARRAHSVDGKVQVELAQLKYLLPRLGDWDSGLSRLTGGIGGRGPGETKLEINRRRVRDRISSLEKRLKELNRSRDQRRSKRRGSGLPIISIVGYTNAGKSTLLNALTRSHVFTENLLFATLDTSSRRLRFPREREVIITDTVGFIRDLPKDLMGAFKATLEELTDADLLLHVADAANPGVLKQIESVERILTDLELDTIPRLTVFNKSDLLEERGLLSALCHRFGGVAISALDPSTLPPLLERMDELVFPVVRPEEEMSIDKEAEPVGE